MPKATKEMISRNELIRAEYNNLYSPIVKKCGLYTQLGEKYGLTSEAIRRIVNQTTAGHYLNNLKEK